MKKRLLKLSVVLFLLFFFIANALAQEKSDLIDKYISKLYLYEAIESFPDHINAASNQRKLLSKKSEFESQLNEIFISSFDYNALKLRLKTYLLENTDKAFLNASLEWLNSDLAERITSEERNSNDVNKQSELVKYLSELQSNPPSQHRINLIQKLEEVTKQSEIVTHIVVDILMGMIDNQALLSSQDEIQKIEFIKSEIQSNKNRLTTAFKQQLILTNYYTYRNIDDYDLQKYIDHYKSEIGKKELSLITKGLSYTLQYWSKEVGRQVIELAKLQKENL